MALNYPSIEKELADWLHKLREEKGLSQEALGVQIGKGQSDVAKIESGSKRLTVVELLHWLNALDIPYSRLSNFLQSLYENLDNQNADWKKRT